MINTVTKWRISYGFRDRDNLIIYMHDNFIANIIHKAADIDFGFNQPITNIKIEMADLFESAQNKQQGSYTEDRSQEKIFWDHETKIAYNRNE